MASKKIGDAWVYWPIACVTGAQHAQPSGPAIRVESCCDFTSDFKVFFNDCGALDAPLSIPSGGVRAQDFEGTPTPGCLLIGHVWRPGTHAGSLGVA